MVIGLGTDLVEVSRVRASVERFGERFLNRVFTTGEQRYCRDRRDPAESLAARFAAKEAAAKALGTGFAGPVGWKDFEVVREAEGPPHLVLHGGGQALARALGADRWHLTLAHTAHLATATVIFERL